MSYFKSSYKVTVIEQRAGEPTTDPHQHSQKAFGKEQSKAIKKGWYNNPVKTPSKGDSKYRSYIFYKN